MRTQLLAAYAELERDLATAALPTGQQRFDAADVTVAVGWHFTQMMLPEIVDKAAYPHLQAFSALAEALPVFVDTPVGARRGFRRRTVKPPERNEPQRQPGVASRCV
ncbi:hypothetical protein LMG28614_01279 [Paraburkholderia ultramafica]|uniref:GST C-terminal domain-containing protein n=1 Tax=Paraburkholderia ultramafica TaxID=1544867 RepID=A0A6S7AXZ7_9BURK|nr:hypothetical protein LMG28614_01279 [Paraburkholderia ultramafica]